MCFLCFIDLSDLHFKRIDEFMCDLTNLAASASDGLDGQIIILFCLFLIIGFESRLLQFFMLLLRFFLEWWLTAEERVVDWLRVYLEARIRLVAAILLNNDHFWWREGREFGSRLTHLELEDDRLELTISLDSHGRCPELTC